MSVLLQHETRYILSIVFHSDGCTLVKPVQDALNMQETAPESVQVLLMPPLLLLFSVNKSHHPPQNITMVTRPRAERSAAVETPVAIATVTEQD